jgi:cobalt/nickel transport system permease protein
VGGFGHGAVVGVAGDVRSPLHRLDPRTKVLGSLAVTVVAVSTPLSAWPALVACALALAAAAAVARLPPALLWRRSRMVLPLVLAVAAFLPFVRDGGGEVGVGPLSVSEAGLTAFAEAGAKAVIGTLSAVVLGATTTFPEVLRALERMRAPRTLTLIAGVMYRYLFVLAGEVRRMRWALASRGYRPRHALAAGATGRLAGAMFLRSVARGERVHLAMMARGYAGTMPRADARSLGRADVLALAVLVVALVGCRVAAAGVA